MTFYGICDLPWWGYLLVLLACTQVTIAAVTLYLHRYSAHRALWLHPIVTHFFRLWLWLTTGMETKKWTAIHRKHHAKCETPEDPHSPQVLGLPMVLWKGAELYRLEGVNKETLDRYGQGTPEDWVEKNIYCRSKWGIGITLAVDLVLFGVPGLAVWAIQMMWIPFFAAGVVNGVGHYWGYRNFECPDAARNVSPIGFFIGGEELHNNHHTYPTSAKFSVKSWEFDIGWVYIRLLQCVGLAKPKRVPPTPALIPGKTQIDLETLKAVFLNRFQVMSHYSKAVLIPAFKKESKLSSDVELSNMKTLLVREDSLLDTTAKQHLAKFLEANNAVRQVYSLKAQLQNLWNERAGKDNELVEALQRWCQTAEETGNVSLREFSAYLRSFTLKDA